MRSTRRVIAVAVLGAVLGAGTLLAQPETDKPVTDLAIGDMLTQAESHEKDIKKHHRHVLHLQEVARKRRDVIKLTCVNERLLQLKAHANLFDQARLELMGGTTVTPEITDAFTRLEKASSDVYKSRVAADACIGEPELSSESTTVVDAPDFPDDPTIGDPFKPGIEPPGYASPFN